MRSKKKLKYLVFITCLILSSAQSWGQFSYVYIQGDKSTPFYVKMQDEMIPRYGKNYCIISQLLPGTITFQVLFQQNAYPPQTFTILVPEKGYRGFLLAKENENFALYDLQQKFYLPAFDTITDVHLPGMPVAPVAIAKADEVVKADTAKTITADTAAKVIAVASDKPHFIDSIQLNNSRVIQPLTTAMLNDSLMAKDTVKVPATVKTDSAVLSSPTQDMAVKKAADTALGTVNAVKADTTAKVNFTDSSIHTGIKTDTAVITSAEPLKQVTDTLKQIADTGAHAAVAVVKDTATTIIQTAAVTKPDTATNSITPIAVVKDTVAPQPIAAVPKTDTVVKPVLPVKDPHLKCAEAMSKEDFDAIFHSALSNNDDTRLLFLMGKMNKCYSTQQVKELLQTLYIESDRYLFCKRVYAHVVDKDNFDSLENMFETNEGKHDFRTIIQ